MTSFSATALSLIRAQVEARLPGSLTTYARPEHEMVLTGIPAIDSASGGIPRSALTQICAPVHRSSGRTTFLLSLFARMTNRGEFCALVDAGDCFDPASADAAGVHLSRMLWVRCGEKRGMRALEQVFKSADIVVQNGGFGLIAIDLANVEERLVRKVPLTTWFRFARVVENLPMALVILVSYPVARSCAALTLEVQGMKIQWSGNETLSHAHVLDAVDFGVEMTRIRLRKPVQSAGREFTARAQWG